MPFTPAASRDSMLYSALSGSAAAAGRPGLLATGSQWSGVSASCADRGCGASSTRSQVAKEYPFVGILQTVVQESSYRWLTLVSHSCTLQRDS